MDLDIKYFIARVYSLYMTRYIKAKIPHFFNTYMDSGTKTTMPSVFDGFIICGIYKTIARISNISKIICIKIIIGRVYIFHMVHGYIKYHSSSLIY